MVKVTSHRRKVGSKSVKVKGHSRRKFCLSKNRRKKKCTGKSLKTKRKSKH